MRQVPPSPTKQVFMLPLAFTIHLQWVLPLWGHFWALPRQQRSLWVDQSQERRALTTPPTTEGAPRSRRVVSDPGLPHRPRLVHAAPPTRGWQSSQCYCLRNDGKRTLASRTHKLCFPPDTLSLRLSPNACASS